MTKVMLKNFILICILVSPVQMLIAQDGPTHSITELKKLLQKSKIGSERMSLLLEAGIVYVMEPGMERNDFDSALYFITNALNLSKKLNEPVWQARCFRMYSQLYRESDQKETGRKYIDSAISIFSKHNLKENLAEAYMELQLYYDIFAEGGWGIKVKYAELAERLYKESGNKLKQAAILKDLGDFYQVAEKDSAALEYLDKALTIYQSVNYPQLQGIYDLVGYVLYNMGDYNQALKYGLMAVETAEKVKAGIPELSTIYNRVGLMYYRLTRYREAVNAFNRSFALALENKDTVAARIIAPNTMNSYLRLGLEEELIAFLQTVRTISEKAILNDRVIYFSTYAQAVMIGGNYKRAEPYVNQLLRLVGDTNDIPLQRSLHRAAIPYYLAAGKYTEMYKYLPVNESICKKINNISALADNYLWWFKADSALGKHTAAIEHYKLYKEASDSSLRWTSSQHINQLLIQHDSYKKDQSIATNENNIRLLIQQDQLQKNKLQQGLLLRNIGTGVVVLLMIIMALLYNRYRLKQRTNRKLELQQREIANKNISLQHLLNEKDWLLKEIHHRVKNNLQIVMSLLNSQSAYIDNAPALTAIHDSQHRVHAMSLIHQKLYNTDNVSLIDTSTYIRELVSYLRDSFNTGQRIRFELSMEPLELDVSQAVPVGLILNEAITNSIKYAFPNDSDGIVTISLTNTSPHHYLLIISDNGIGIAPGIKKTGSLGMSLMKGLAEDLEGNFSIENDNGTTIKISFVHDVNIKRPEILVSSFVASN